MKKGVSYIANRYGKADDKYMEEYDEESSLTYIMYLDANNLYDCAMSLYLPTGNFRWMTDKKINKIDSGKCKTNDKKGLILEVNLKYQGELHDLHNDYCLAPEKMKVTKNMLSRYCKRIAEKLKISIGQINELIPTLKSKEKYVLH